jgi:dihydroxyacetone kinase phosphotransfer subunit
MVGIVVVSHSAPLAEAAVKLALEMAPGGPPPIAVAAGAVGGATGTDAVAIAEGIGAVASDDGVLVLMDLGSALLSAEMALEFAAVDCSVRLVAAPFVEGLVVAVVAASAGLGLDEVAAQAVGALAAKQEHLGQDNPVIPADPPVIPAKAGISPPGVGRGLGLAEALGDQGCQGGDGFGGVGAGCRNRHLVAGLGAERDQGHLA